MLGELTGISRKHFTSILLAAFCGLMLLAWASRFTQDDAYISFRYAEHLVHGEGLVWNEGERVEGYTNFLWTLLLAGSMGLGVDPVFSSLVLGVGFFGVSLLFTYRLCRLLLRSELASLVAVVLLGTHYTFSCYATGGLETQMQTALFTAICFLALEGILAHKLSTRRVTLLAVLMTAAMLTRMDSVIFCAVIASAVVYHTLRARGPGAARRGAILVGIPALCMGLWFLWKLSYYGSIIPNPFYIKATSASSFSRGVNYLWLYGLSYFLLPFPLLAVLAMGRVLRERSIALFVMLSGLVLWLLYIIKIGGDFMEFRFLVPVMPILFTLIAWLTFVFVRWRLVQAALILLVLAGDVHHKATFSYNREDAVEAVRELEAHLFSDNQNWAGIGRTLGKVFGGTRGVTIATTAAGAIPFYSGLPAVDMLGVNDPWVAQHGFHMSSIPGHQRISPMKYLMDRNVNLVISHPLVLRSSEPVTQIPLLPVAPGDNLSGVQIVEIPIDSDHKFLALYLTPSPEVNSAI